MEAVPGSAAAGRITIRLSAPRTARTMRRAEPSPWSSRSDTPPLGGRLAKAVAATGPAGATAFVSGQEWVRNRASASSSGAESSRIGSGLLACDDVPLHLARGHGARSEDRADHAGSRLNDRPVEYGALLDPGVRSNLRARSDEAEAVEDRGPRGVEDRLRRAQQLEVGLRRAGFEKRLILDEVDAEPPLGHPGAEQGDDVEETHPAPGRRAAPGARPLESTSPAGLDDGGAGNDNGVDRLVREEVDAGEGQKRRAHR